ncbi:MAG: DUF4234 domain-containing protein [Thermoleophilia bacterium]
MDNSALLGSDIRRKSYTDWQTGFWKAFLLSVITFGIYGVYVLYKLLERREQHFERMVSLRGHLVGVLEEAVAAAGGSGELGRELSELEALDLDATGRDRYGEKTPVLWLVLGLFTGVTNFYVYYFLNDDFHAHEAGEQAFLLKAAGLMDKLGMRWEAPVVASVPRRSFVKYLLLTLVTLGFFGIYWWYTLIVDANRHFDGHLDWEPRLRAALGTE